MEIDRHRAVRFAVPIAASLVAAAAGAALQAAVGYRFPLITFYPAIMISGWYGGFWSGVTATATATALTNYLWLGPLRARDQSTLGDIVALVLFVGVGVTISAFCGSLHRSTAREHESAARERRAREHAEAGEAALKESEHNLRLALAGERVARAEAQDANRMKDQFLAMVSHELRTPLNALLGWADMLKRGVLREDRRERAIDAIHANATRQAQLVDDLLDLARILSGKLQLQPTHIHVEEPLRASMEIVQPAADAKGIELTLEVESPDLTLLADGMRLQQVFWNVLSNAIKFTPDHGVIHVNLRQAENDVEIAIRDTGQGIPTELLQTIFEPFRQADSSSTRAHSGLGLGLAIVKHVIEAHGGSVRAESAGEGRGATFSLRLPLEFAGIPVAAPASPVPKSVSMPSELSGTRVLVVDDDADSREVMAAHLELHGVTVMTAASAHEALTIVQREPVRALLVDVAMPGLDGYAFIRTIRSLPSKEIASLPAAAVTAFATPADRDLALQAGFQAHIAKPVNSSTLAQILIKLIARRSDQPTARSAATVITIQTTGERGRHMRDASLVD